MLLRDIITVPYTTGPKMIRNKEDYFQKNPSTKYLSEKRKQLDLYDNDLYGQTNDSISKRLVGKVSVFCGKRYTEDIVEFAMEFEEDVAVMHDGILTAICFCFPSSWVPSEKIGFNLEQIHAPVADGDKLRSVSKKLSSTMADPVLGSFRRYVWTITNNPELSNHPKNKKETIPQSLQDLYFRMETQTTVPVGDCLTSLFFVKVDVFPLIDIWEDYGKNIVDSINSMSDSILKYKNLEHIKKILNLPLV